MKLLISAVLGSMFIAQASFAYNGVQLNRSDDPSLTAYGAAKEGIADATHETITLKCGAKVDVSLLDDTTLKALRLSNTGNGEGSN